MNEKRARMRAQLQQQIIEENQRRLTIEAEVAQMEQEELELIQKLQNTQVVQKTAYEDLENALTGDPVMTAESPEKPMSASGRGVGSANKNRTPQNAANR